MEEALSSIGLGWFQVPPIATVLLIQGSYATQHIATVFTDMPRDFKCYLSKPDDESLTNFDNLCVISNTTDISIMGSEEHICTEFVYDNTLFESTFSSEFNLVCEKAWLSGIFKSAGFFGVIFGCVLTGMGDKWGRVIVIQITTFIYLVSVIVVGLVTEIYSVIIARFIVGFCYEILNASSYTLMMEVLPTKYRSTVGAVVSNIAYVFFVIIIGVVSYFIRSWRILHLILSFPVYLLTICIFFLHRSPRWLINNGKVNEGIDVLNKGANLNNAKLPSESLDKIRASFVTSSKDSDEEIQIQTNQKSYTFTSLVKILFGTSTMLKISVISPVIWFLTSIAYFSIPLNANNFSSNPFLYLIVMSFADIPPNFIVPVLLKFLGNVKTISIMFIITMAGLVSAVFVPDPLTWLKWLVIIISTITISSSYMINFILGSELFPTPVRSIGFGMGSFARHTGVLTIQYLIDTASSRKILWLPNAVAAGCCLVAGAVSATLLPETHGHPLCDTVEQVENRNKEIKESKS